MTKNSIKGNIGIVVVATGKYIKYVEPFWASTKKFFLNGHKFKIHLFVFTDSKKTPSDVTTFYQKHRKFPYPTLMRYHIFLKHEKELSKMNYLYYCDVDMLFTSHIGKEILSQRVATLHPGFYNKKRQLFSYETRKESTAYISPQEGKSYFCGGFNGGSAIEYLKMAKVISKNIDIDLKKKIVALWHDESHLNRYLIDHPPTKILSPAYCYPEEATLPFPKKLIALQKDHAVMRYSQWERILQRLWLNLLEFIGPTYRYFKKLFLTRT